ncbi:hypothetical protein [Natrinema sp. 74]|uniref:hypothetical protein n=1 Tax=Natrinema sp. 74 TaxID=3384159 RepID=UPI0038D377A9
MTESTTTDGGSVLPDTIQTHHPFGFAVANVCLGVLVVSAAALALGERAPAALSVGVIGVVATGSTAAVIAALSETRTAIRQRDNLRDGLAEVSDRAVRLADGDRDVSFVTDRTDEFDRLEGALASIRERSAASERTDASLDGVAETRLGDGVDRAVSTGDPTPETTDDGDAASL